MTDLLVALWPAVIVIATIVGLLVDVPSLLRKMLGADRVQIATPPATKGVVTALVAVATAEALLHHTSPASLEGGFESNIDLDTVLDGALAADAAASKSMVGEAANFLDFIP
jgi:hypothetical protein